MQLILDRDSFERPLLAAFDVTVEAPEDAGKTVLGAQVHTQPAKRDLEDLRRFTGEVAGFLRAGTLAMLPPLRVTYWRMSHCYHLTVGAWKGVFLIDPGGVLAIGLLFSKAPHNFLDRVQELVVQHTHIEPAEENEGG